MKVIKIVKPVGKGKVRYAVGKIGPKFLRLENSR